MHGPNFNLVVWRGIAKFALQHRRGVRPRTEIIPYELDAAHTAERTCRCANARLGLLPRLLVRLLINYHNAESMKVHINRKEIEVAQGVGTLAELLRAEGFDGAGRAVAVNNRVVPKAEWEIFKIEDGMNITVIRAVCGG